jgi:hypothetical protein
MIISKTMFESEGADAYLGRSGVAEKVQHDANSGLATKSLLVVESPILH